MKKAFMQNENEHAKNQILTKHDINGIFAKEMHKLSEFKLVMICDDSTSVRFCLCIS
jgi:hypothetical protein